MPRVMDAERRLAMALEAYGEIVRGGDEQRAEVLIRELEVPYYESRRPKKRRAYEDPVRQREDQRGLRRELQAKRKQVERLRKQGGGRRALRELEREIQVLEELTG